jgi:ligand-binding sensor domain-containing protein
LKTSKFFKFSNLTFWGAIIIIAVLFIAANRNKHEGNIPAANRNQINGQQPSNSADTNTSAASRRIGEDSKKREGNLLIPFSPIIKTAAINDLVVDSRGTLWGATEEGVCSISNGLLREFSLTRGTFPALQAQCIAFDGQKIWVGTLFGLYSITRSGIVTKHQISQDPASEIIWDITFDGITIWVATQAGIAFKNKKNDFFILDKKVTNGGLRNNWCQNILRFSGWFIVAHDNGISCWNTGFKASNPEFWKNIDNARSGIVRPVSGMTFDGQNIWIATAKGALFLNTPIEKLFSESVSSFVSYTTVHGLPSNRVNDIITHRGAIWLATNGGLARIDQEEIQTISPTDGTMAQNLTALAASGDILWIGNNEGVRFINTAMVD